MVGEDVTCVAASEGILKKLGTMMVPTNIFLKTTSLELSEFVFESIVAILDRFSHPFES